MSTSGPQGVIFDLDGVITGTARVHSMAWESMFNRYLQQVAERDGKPFQPFTAEDYLAYVDGKPRMQGVRSFLESRGIDLPFGDHDDSPDVETVCGLGNRKNLDFQKVLKEEGPDVFASSVELVRELKRRGIRVGVASSSRNCRLILELAGLDDLFETRVDGDVSLELGLKGKPDPDIFTTAAANLDLRPGQCVVVEDAISGVQAGCAGNFGLTLGVARETPGDVLLANGADLAVRDLGEISVDDLEDWFRNGLERDGWTFAYQGLDPENEKLREALTTVGNGYLGVRGALETERASEHHYPGTYLAGVFNKIPTPLHGRDIYNNDFVNCPNWLLMEFRVDQGEYISPMDMEVLSYSHALHLREAVLERRMVVKDNLGRITRLVSRRLASMADPHLLAQRLELTPVNWSGRVTVRSGIDGNIINDGVARYRQLNQQHLEFVKSGKAAGGVFLETRTTASGYHVAMSAKHVLFDEGRRIHGTREVCPDRAFIGEELSFPAGEGRCYAVDKLVSVYTSLDAEEPRRASVARLDRARSFRQLHAGHAKAWERLWDKADIKVGGDRLVQRTLRLHAYHLLVTASPHNRNLDAGMPARGLSGEAYRGHIFWDELYILPFYDLRFPEISKALLSYRYNRLEGARQYAREHGYEGAMFPWQTADGGEEETQEVHFNPKSGDWGPDLSRRQRHVSIAVFFNTWRYVHCTGDWNFMRRQGAELMLSIARFWGSIAQKDEATGQWHIDGVMGPDEFHESLPGSNREGLRDNAYTNVMSSWLLERAVDLLERLSPADRKRVAKRSGLRDEEPERWQEIARGLHVSLNEQGVIEQFAGYFGLDELDWDAYRAKYGDIHRLDRILKAEGDSPDHYKLAKQADTLMMFYALPPETIVDILGRLGHDVGDPATLLRRNYDYYEGRTSHGSTLSKVVHALISSYFGDDATAWQWFLEALVSDIHDSQGGTTLEGIHTGVMAGTLDIVTRYFAGVDVTGERLTIQPHLPAHWSELELKLRFRGDWYGLRLKPGKLRVTLLESSKDAVHLVVQGRSVELTPGRARTVTLDR
ncbi:haloacid dehalogenase superfamily, subfamily IA, variant 3 with third motif having DD or ED/beta-phosphoglucomutase family hydrolase [Paucidesulfovibrio gracilis DSM 16080]|uniref:Haloacid dehalogenase superfamily, subfamily IA, variant 3 with third motif having DD or ED/beta-phosphoglucomutase family hydrolase n=1 Tax=Paucidesulfovibrio gracilis DSM 16080 TaxID=1121449 RepID=A0A1T4WCA8_9BACT|nr:beta-phosphoglucomutase family hydrolase [Paucidesulfovibrio gracilis]SKA74923.1 haloacid dehalogenase superfamily, subfamily IA, variant 3 with third motif having DD or ED/beta-phosphoglucomutase family hydrolase [Paucidesulfovibrio gracilis DSM 16080]